MGKPPSQAAANYVEPDFEKIVNKPITALQEHFLDWVLSKTGVTFPTKKEEAAFAEGVRIGVALRGPHQASPENQERLAQAREAAEAARTAEAEPEAKPAKATKAAPAKAAPAKAAKATKSVPPAAAATTTAVRRPAKKTTPSKAAKAAAPAVEDEAPF